MVGVARLWYMHVPLHVKPDVELRTVQCTASNVHAHRCCFLSVQGIKCPGKIGSRISMYEHMYVPRTDLQIAYDTQDHEALNFQFIQSQRLDLFL